MKQNYLRHKYRLVVGGHVVGSKEYTTYSSTIKDVYMRLMIWIYVNNGLGLMAGYIIYSLCMASCAQNIWSRFGAYLSPRCGVVVVLNQDLYGLNTE